MSISNTIAQQLDNIKDQQALTINGFISTNQVFNTQPTDSGAATNYSGYYTGNLNFGIYGVSVPLTFNYSNNQGNFTHPFNQYGIHPSYKWVKGHIGYASMTFSPYTLSGHLFLGAGAELDIPGPLRASVMYGRLKKAVDYDSTQPGQAPAYKRMGYGIKVGVANENDYIDLVLFGAKDTYTPIDSFPGGQQILPQQNAAFSVIVGKTIAKKLTFKAELANSYLTSDTRTLKSDERKKILEPASLFTTSRLSSTSRNAFKANLNYKFISWNLGACYERVGPDYATLGAYYFTNNLENITINSGVSLWQSKVNLNGNVGLQRDNLDNSKLNNNKRYVGSANATITPGEKLNFGLSYSNFLSYTNVRSTFDYINETSPYENWDTLNYRQISQNVNINSSYQLANSKKNRQSLSANLTYQVSDNQDSDTADSKSKFYNLNTSYVIAIIPANLTITTGMNANRNDAPEALSSTWGPSLTISKSFFEKTLRSSLTVSYNTSRTNHQATGEVYNFRMGCTYSLKKKHNFNLNLLYQYRNSNNRNVKTATVSGTYSYNFNILDKTKQKEGEE